MSTPNQEPKPPTNMDALKQEAEACGAGCACHANATPGRARWALGAIILLLAAALALRAVMRSNSASTSQSAAAATAFTALPGAGAAVAAEPAVAVTPAATAATVPPTAAAAAPAVQASATVVGQPIGAFAELNTLAADTTAVLVFVPEKGTNAAPPPTAQMDAAARTIAAQGNKIGLFTLKADSPDYEQILGQVAAPGVLVLVKGRGMQAVSGEVTETKLVQAFVAASSAGGCGSGSAGCGAATPGCK